MLDFIYIVCDGDVKKMAKRVMTMMFFDEWLCHFEMKGGMSATSLWDKEKNYG